VPASLSARAYRRTARPPADGSAPWSCRFTARESWRVSDSQGLGIPANIKDPKAAAAFLEYLQSPEQLKALHDKTGWIPANTSFDTSVIEDPTVRDMWQRWGLSENIPYLSNLVPGQFYEQALLPTAQQVVEGKITGEQAGDLAYNVAKEWRDFNPDIVENYKKWATDLGG
jgi:ABC-type glycerol-3-phosphate transport system substrate-binding protein